MAEMVNSPHPEPLSQKGRGGYLPRIKKNGMSGYNIAVATPVVVI
jgi:hypothetical protein